jgi:uncharacterized protein YjiK
MTSFEEVLRIAQDQAALVARGDVEAAVARLDERGSLLSRAPAPLASDTDTIEEILRLDRVLSSAIRERMVHIRNEALEGQRGKRALSGYGVTLPRQPVALDAIR